jgi:hypothetical protein
MSDPERCGCARCQQEPNHLEAALHQRLKGFVHQLDERRRRWFAGLEALRRGRGGIREVSQITGLDEKTVRQGRREIIQGLPHNAGTRIRRPGAGRKRIEKKVRASS